MSGASQESTISLGVLLTEQRDKMTRLVRCRMDRRLQGRVDPSDVVQEAFVEVVKRYAEFQQSQKMPFSLWLRLVTLQQLAITHRSHVKAQKRSVDREVNFSVDESPAGNVALMADILSGSITSPISAVARNELQTRLTAALESLDPQDREVLVLRHFEQLDNAESALVLGISQGLVGTRYGRAVRKLLAVLKDLFGPDCEFGL